MSTIDINPVVDSVGKFLFYESLGGQFGLHHWPGEEPRPVVMKSDPLRELDLTTIEFGTEGKDQFMVYNGIMNRAAAIVMLVNEGMTKLTKFDA